MKRFSVKSSESFKNSSETRRHLADTLKTTTFLATEAPDINVFLEITRLFHMYMTVLKFSMKRIALFHMSMAVLKFSMKRTCSFSYVYGSFEIPGNRSDIFDEILTHSTTALVRKTLPA
jgi:hypothetical protein